MQDKSQLPFQGRRKKPENYQEQYIIGIGASAGGLEAINELFDNIPKGSGYTFVVVQHLSPNHKSLMDELLAKHTSIPIEQAGEGMPVLPDRIYLIPNKKNMTIHDGKLHLIDKPVNNSPNYGIDIFFESLAKEKKEKAIGVVLSGTGSDGTKGVAEIKRYGGMVLVQDPATAKFDGMPNSAISSGYYDKVLPPEFMCEEIFQYVGTPSAGRFAFQGDDEENNAYLKEILGMVKEYTTFDFSSYKEQTLRRRLVKRINQLDVDDLREYLFFLRNNPDEVKFLSNEFLIGVTCFFRDAEAFSEITDKVIPEVLKRKSPDNPVKVWVAACSTGEEAYSLAIVLAEALENKHIEVPVKIFATDIDSRAVEYAAKGVYPLSIESEVSEERLRKYFVKEDNHYCINQHIRRMVIFAEHNLIKDPPFSKMDLVSCRNMLIYMKPNLQQKVLTTFHFSLKVGGYLFLGPSESHDAIKSSLQVVSKKWNIFKIVTNSKNFLFDGTPFDKDKIASHKAPDVRPSRRSLENDMSEAFQDLVSEELGYAMVFVNEEYELMQAIGDYKRFIRMPEKMLQMNLLKLVPRELSVALNLALRKAQRNNEKVVSHRVEMLQEGGVTNVTLIIKPFQDANQYHRNFIGILFKEEGNKRFEPSEENFFDQQVSINRVVELENELKQTKEDLQSAVEELETSNEELQSSNEELISSNEELQSTNEELQSLNEELHTVNSEHQLKIRQLEELNDDLNNYFRGTDIGQVFVDNELIVRKFTPAVKNQVNLIETDIGRPISHLSYNIKQESFVEDIQQVINSSQPLLKEIEARNGKYYLMKVIPYLRQDGTTEGAVVTFVDISQVKGLNNLLEGVLDSSLNGIMAFQKVEEKGKLIDLEWSLVNQAAKSILNKEGARLVGKRLSKELPGFNKDGLLKKIMKVALNGNTLHTEINYGADEESKWLEIIAVSIENGVALTIIDISEKKNAEDELVNAYDEVKEAEEKLRKLNLSLEERVKERTRELFESEERLRLVSRATNDAVWDWNLVNNDLWWNEGYHKVFGYPKEENNSGVDTWFNQLHPDEKDAVIQSINEAINQGKKQWAAEHRFRKSDGTYAFVYNRGYIITNEYDVPFRMLGSMVDLTKLRTAQEDLEESNRNLKTINTDLDNFVYTASHDLKAPVTNLEGLVKLLVPKLEGKLDAKEQKTIDMIEVSLEKLKRTISGLLEITKVQKDLERNIQELSFEKVLNDAKADVDDLIEKCKAQLEVDFQVPTIQYTRYNLRSILYNLLSNALKYCSKDRKPFIKLKTEDAGSYVLLTFTDNGLGMNKAQVKKLFSMFKRFHPQVEGTGIGLYMVKRIIENNAGKIEVDSEEGKGTEFRIYFKKDQQQDLTVGMSNTALA